MMKIQRFSIQLGISFALIAGLMPTQMPAAQAQSNIQDSDNGAGGFDSTVLAPASQSRTITVIPASTTNETVNVSFTILNQLREGNYNVEEFLSLPQEGSPENLAIDPNRAQPNLQQNLASILTNPTEEAKNDWISRLTNEGIPEAEATKLIEAIAGIFREVDNVSSVTDRNFRTNISLREDLATELVKAVTAYNNLIEQSNSQVLQNPPPSLLAIRFVILQAAGTTRII